MKKILHINSVIYTGGGIIKKIIHLIENDKENEHVIFFAWYSDPDNKRSDIIKLLNELGIKFDYIYHNSIWASIPDFYKYLKNHSYDILHYYTDNVLVLGKIVQLMGINTPAVRSLEGFPLYTHFPQKQLVNWAFTSCHHIVSISRFVELRNCEVYSSLKECNKTVIYNAPIGNLEIKNIIDKRNGLICVGRLDKQKQFDVAIEIVSILKHKYGRHINLLIVGDGADKPKLIKLTQKLNVSELVELTGIVDDPTAYYDSSRIFLHPAYNEGFGLVVTEAMSMGLCVLVSNSGALPEIIENGKTGYILPLKDAESWAALIDKIYDNKKLLENLGNAAHKRVNEKFSSELHIKGYNNFYNSIISEQ